jgi:signal peptidase I
MGKIKLSFVTFFSVLLFTVGCSKHSTTETITDPDTKSVVPTVQTITSDMIVIHYMGDSMDRGNHDFFDKDVVVDTEYYKPNPLKRGDIIVRKTKDYEEGKNLGTGKGYDILRVVGLPNEKVKIEKAKIYVDGKKLDTFYGEYHRLGMDMEQYLAWRKETNQPNDQGKTEDEVRKENLTSYDIKETTIKENEVFVVGDDWFRSGRLIIPQDDIIGKVLGYR